MTRFTLYVISILIISSSTILIYKGRQYIKNNDLFKNLSKENQKIYEEIIDERQTIFFHGAALGMIINSLYFYYAVKNKISRHIVIGISLLILFMTNVIYYHLAPKKKWMLNYLKERTQVDAWLDLYRTVSRKFYSAFFVNLIGNFMFIWASI